MGIRLKLLDVPEPLSLSELTLASSTVNVRANAETTFFCETALLKVLDGITWSVILAANMKQPAPHEMPPLSPLATVTVGSFVMRWDLGGGSCCL